MKRLRQTLLVVLMQHLEACLTRCFVMNDAGMIIHDRSWLETGGNSDHVMRQHPQIGQDLQKQGYANVQQCTKFNANTKVDDNRPQIYKAWKVKHPEQLAASYATQIH